MERLYTETAVEWFWNEIAEVIPFTVDSTTAIKMYDKLQQAKEMEKEKMIKFAEHCLDKALDLDIRTAFSNVEQYYNETFKSE